MYAHAKRVLFYITFLLCCPYELECYAVSTAAVYVPLHIIVIGGNANLIELPSEPNKPASVDEEGTKLHNINRKNFCTW